MLGARALGLQSFPFLMTEADGLARAGGMFLQVLTGRSGSGGHRRVPSALGQSVAARLTRGRGISLPIWLRGMSRRKLRPYIGPRKTRCL